MGAILEGITVLDFSEYIAGPYAGFLLADLGADVIKIEPPDGSEERRWGNSQRYKGNTRTSLTMNRGKRSLCLDMGREEARKIVYRLAEKADIVIQNYAPGVAKKLGIDYDTLSAINKGLIFISSTAFGEIGPYQKRKGFDIIAHAAAGIMAGYADGDGNPRGPGGAPFIDIGTGMLNAFSAVSALFARSRTGEGQKIETSLFNTGMALLATGFSYIEELDRERHEQEHALLKNAIKEKKTHTQIIDAITDLRNSYEMPEAMGKFELPDCNHRPSDRWSFPHYRIYETADGFIGLAALTSRQRTSACEVLGIDSKFAGVELSEITNEVIDNIKSLNDQMEARFHEKTNNEWIEALEKAGVPCGPVNYSVDLFNDPQALAVDMIWNLKNSGLGPYKMIGHPVRYPKNPAKPGKGAPTLGEDSIAVLEQFGFHLEEIDAFKKQGVVR